MPISVHGFGTGVLSAWRQRTVEGSEQFDAIEAFMLVYCPVLPYRAYHVLSIGHDPKDCFCERFQSMPLGLSPRLIAKAFLNRWGNVLAFLGGIMSFACATMERPFTPTDKAILIGIAVLVLVGIVFKA